MFFPSYTLIRNDVFFPIATFNEQMHSGTSEVRSLGHAGCKHRDPAGLPGVSQQRGRAPAADEKPYVD